MVTNILSKKNSKLSLNIFEELTQCSLKASSAIKKCEDLHKLAEDSLINIRRKSKSKIRL